MFKIFKEKLLGKGLTGSLEKRLLDWVCDNQTRHKMQINGTSTNDTEVSICRSKTQSTFAHLFDVCVTVHH